MFGLLVAGVLLLDMFRLVAVPLVMALFPAALLSPISSQLKQWGFPPLLAAFTVVFGLLIALLGLLAALV